MKQDRDLPWPYEAIGPATWAVPEVPRISDLELSWSNLLRCNATHPSTDCAHAHLLEPLCPSSWPFALNPAAALLPCRPSSPFYVSQAVLLSLKQSSSVSFLSVPPTLPHTLAIPLPVLLCCLYLHCYVGHSASCYSEHTLSICPSFSRFSMV
jgi:hypothetical protein